MEPYVPRKGFESYFWYLKDDIKHRMYLSRDAKKMLEVIQNRLAIVWHDPEMDRHDFKEEGLPKLVKWHTEYKIRNFPFLALEVCSLPYFLSGDFKFMCDYDYSKKVMNVVKTENGELISSLPKSALAVTQNNFEKENVMEAFSSVAVRGNEKIETVNQDTGLKTIWPVTNNGKEGQFL